MLLTVKDVTVFVPRLAGIGMEWGRGLVFFQAVGNDQAIRAMQYVLKRRQSEQLLLSRWSSSIPQYLVRGKWQVKVEQMEVQGVNMRLLTAYIPKGTWEGEEYYFFVTQGQPSTEHDDLFRRWAEEHMPYPIPPFLGAHHLDHFLPNVRIAKGRSALDENPPYVVAFTGRDFEILLEEVTK